MKSKRGRTSLRYYIVSAYEENVV